MHLVACHSTTTCSFEQRLYNQRQKNAAVKITSHSFNDDDDDDKIRSKYSWVSKRNFDFSEKTSLKCTNVAISRNWKIDRFLYDNDRVKRDEKYLRCYLDQIGLGKRKFGALNSPEIPLKIFEFKFCKFWIYRSS